MILFKFKSLTENSYLSIGGYKNNVCYWYQPKNVDIIFRALFAAGPIVLCFISTVCIYFYSLKTDELSNEYTEPQVAMKQ
jgi:hypothetical protein